MGLVALEHALVDRAGHDVARRERPHGVHGAQELPAGGIGDPGAFAAKGLCEEQASLRMEQRRRMKLNVFEVQETRPGPARHGDSVAPRAARVGRVEIHLPQPAGREDRLARQLGADLSAVPIEQVCAGDRRRPVALRGIGRVVGERQQIHGRRGEAPLNVLLPAAGVEQRPFDGHPRLVLDVEDARHRMAALESPVKA